MHSCLYVPEILQEVVQELLPYQKRKCLSSILPSYRKEAEIRDVAALTLTSKHFLEAGLDALWHRVDTLDRILILLGVSPEDLKTISPRPPVGGDDQEGKRLQFEVTVAKIVNVIANADLDRCGYYLHRVRSLRIFEVQVPLWLIRSLCQRFQESGTPITPNVSYLVWHVRGECGLDSFLHMFCGRGLTRLAMYPGCAAFNSTFLQVNFPQLEGIEFLHTIPAFDGDVTHEILQLPPLRSIDVMHRYQLSADSVSHLSAMPRLQSLSFDSMTTGNRVMPHPSHRLETFFPALQRLRIRNVELRSCARMLQTIRDPRSIEQIDIGYHLADTPSSIISEYIKTAAEELDPHGLTHFCLNFGTGSQASRALRASEDMSTHRVTSSQLRPLLAFRNLEICHIFPHALQFDDDLIASMASTWPKLRELVLLSHPYRPYHPSQSRATLLGLVPLAKYCPQLSKLALGLTPLGEGGLTGLDDTVRSWSRCEEQAPTPLKLWIYCVQGLDGLTAPGDAPGIAQYLKTIFPKMSYINDGRLSYYILPDKFPSTTEDKYMSEYKRAQRQYPHWLYPEAEWAITFNDE